MKRVVGFGLLCAAIGMLVVLLLANKLICIILIAIGMLLGYNLFCGCGK